ncbi:hypothetical protein LIER_12042 [Lithospermum erythrorhizon]|uniref:DUF4283 domain-containing protein n=1 Tax=Lithospermum erythrorhizon TaxID=34254 RepID=A0AAV3PRY5_LITER
MDADILRSLISCSLTEEEAKPVVLEEEDLIDGVVECEASAFVKIHSLNLGFVSIQNFSLATAKAWNCKKIRVSRVTGPLLHVFFPSIEEKMQIMETGAWCFDNHLLIVKNWMRGLDPQTVSFYECKFWFQVQGLNEEFYTEVASKLSSSFSACKIMELRRDKAGKKLFRVKATVNVNQPLRRLVNFHVSMLQGAVYLAYERLPYLCFHCGLMGHLIRQWPTLSDGESPHKHAVYGLWIKAPTEKSRVEFRLIADTFSSGKMVDDGKLVPEFPLGFGPTIKNDLIFQNSKFIKSQGLIVGKSIEETIISPGINAENDTNCREEFSDPASPKFKTALNANHLDQQATFNSNSGTANMLPHGTAGGFMEAIKFFDFRNTAPTITQPKESSLLKELPDGKRILKGSHSKGLSSRKRHHPYNKDDGIPSPDKKTLLSDSRLEDARNLDSMADSWTP